MSLTRRGQQYTLDISRLLKRRGLYSFFARWPHVLFSFCNLRNNVIYLPAFSGGETIKGISQQSGARIELQRNPPPNSDPNIKMFTVRGSAQQIDYARQLVEEKIGVNRDYLTSFS